MAVSTFGDRVREARARAGDGARELSQAYVAQQLGQPQQWLSKIERGITRAIPFEDMLALAAVIKEDPYYLFTGQHYTGVSPWLRQLEQYEAGLDSRGRETVLQTAIMQVRLAAEDATLPATADAATPPAPPRRPTRQRLDDATEREIADARRQQEREAAASQRRAAREGRAG